MVSSGTNRAPLPYLLRAWKLQKYHEPGQITVKSAELHPRMYCWWFRNAANHLLSIKPYEKWDNNDNLPINWCTISSLNSMILVFQICWTIFLGHFCHKIDNGFPQPILNYWLRLLVYYPKNLWIARNDCHPMVVIALLADESNDSRGQKILVEKSSLQMTWHVRSLQALLWNMLVQI